MATSPQLKYVSKLLPKAPNYNPTPNYAASFPSFGAPTPTPTPTPTPALTAATTSVSPKENSNLAGRRALFADMQAAARGDAGSKPSGFRERAKALGIDDAGYTRGINRAEKPLPTPTAKPSLGGLGRDSLGNSIGKLGESRSLGTQSGAMRREALRLRKQGYSRAAEEMAMGASTQRLNEPSILTQEQRGRLGEQSRQADAAGAEAAALQSEYTQFMRDAIKKRRGEMNATPK